MSVNGSDQLAYVYRDKTILNFHESCKLLKQIVPEHLDHIDLSEFQETEQYTTLKK